MIALAGRALPSLRGVALARTAIAPAGIALAWTELAGIVTAARLLGPWRTDRLPGSEKPLWDPVPVRHPLFESNGMA